MGELSRARASFRLSSDALEPGTVTQRLGLTPSLAYAKGEMSPPGPVTGRSYPRRTGVWLLTSELGESASLDDHLRSLLDRLDKTATEVRALKDMGYEVDFFCGLFLESLNEGAWLSPETLQRIAALGAVLDLDIYSHCPDPTLLAVATGWWWRLHGRWRRWRRTGWPIVRGG